MNILCLEDKSKKIAKKPDTIRYQLIRAAITEADRNAERTIDGAINSVLKIPKVISLKTLLDAHSRRDSLSPGNEPDMVDRELKEKAEEEKKGNEEVNQNIPSSHMGYF